ncbi:MAG: prepilin-type N-terminal cleavage/methylation domain-containing protein [Opitutaceae bacterium]|jgi:prepilin-type N-terminal cleavage/methylation domain-containing protein/prepilin-type processing-associated H-X9-DG protein|nr:prepilin-type N-terminal cleavage/methylation domain-containing protein [Opitutaceae bacterium]
MKLPRSIIAFTLIELLTVIAIIGILAAIMIPTVGSVRKSAMGARCVSNLRQMGPAFAAYTMDHKDRYPLPYQQYNGNPDNNWWYHLAPYAGRMVATWEDIKSVCGPTGTLGCPGTDLNDTRWQKPWVSYKMPVSHRDYVRSHGGETTSDMGLPVPVIQNPASAILVTEGRTHPFFNTWSGEVADEVTGVVYPHKDQLNALFVDGHVRTLTQAKLKEGWDIYYKKALVGYTAN